MFPSINDPNQRRCEWGKIRKYTLEIFLERSREVHGDKYDYSGVTRDHINGVESKVPVKCGKCLYEWSPTIKDHITRERKCPSCVGQAPWTLERFLTKAFLIHGGKYDYSYVTKEHIRGKDSKVPLVCKKCHHEWSPTIHAHINGGTKCPDCTGSIKWTIERFLVKAPLIHGDKYDYSHITSTDVQNVYSKIQIVCRKCGHNWSPSIGSHINGKRGCRNCARLLPWTLESFVFRAKQIHGDKYDYSNILHCHVKNAKCKIPIVCRKCNYKWFPTIDTHISGKNCPNCVGHSPWTYDRFLSKAMNVHKDKYDYSQVLQVHIQTGKSKIPVICKRCNYNWSPTINGHIYNKSGCPKCKCSKGELAVMSVLLQLNIKFERQWIHPNLPRKRYDFIVFYNDMTWLIEFDGEQHFTENTFFHRNDNDFYTKQQTDMLKTYIACNYGHKLIRLDYTNSNEDNIKYHLLQAFSLQYPLYCSDSSMYKWLTEGKIDRDFYNSMISS
jgi:formylmethanofuran dehydrogenase subunit E/very-short-patch-repair endonuclease